MVSQRSTEESISRRRELLILSIVVDKPRKIRTETCPLDVLNGSHW